MATRQPTAQDIQESTQLYNDINAIFTKMIGPQARIQNHRPFNPPPKPSKLKPSTFYSFIVPAIGLTVQNEAGSIKWISVATLRDGASYFALSTPTIRAYEFKYEKDPIKYSVVHILTLNTELSLPIPWRENREITLIARAAEPYSIVTIPEDADIADEDVDNYVVAKVKSNGLKEEMRVGLRHRVVINVLKNQNIDRFICPQIRIIVASNETRAPVVVPDSRESVPAFPLTTQAMQGHGAYPPPAAPITSQTQHQYPYIGQTQQPLGQQPPYVPPPAWSMPGTSQGPPPSTSGRGSQQQSMAQYLQQFATGLQNWEFEQQHLPEEEEPPLIEEDAPGQANEGAAIGLSVPPAWPMQGTPSTTSAQGLQQQFYSAPSAAIASSLSQASGAPAPHLHPPAGRGGSPSTAQQGYQQPTAMQAEEQSMEQYFDEFATSLQNWEFEQQHLPEEEQPPLMEEDAPGQANEGAAFGSSVPPAWPMQGTPQQRLGQQPPYVPPPAWPMQGTPSITSAQGLQQQPYSAPSAAVGSSLSQASGTPALPHYTPAGGVGPPPSVQQEEELEESIGSPSMSKWLKYSMGVNDDDDGGEN